MTKTSELPQTLSGKVALITGSGRGIGRAIALDFAKRGASIVINFAHSEDEALDLQKEIEKFGGKSVVIKADLGKLTEIEKLVEGACEKLGRIDILVNNAGVEKKAPFWEVTEKDFDLILHVDLKAVFFTTQLVVKNWIEKKQKGKVINISSVHEQLPFPGYASYCAAKGGVGMLTKTLAVELGPFGINVNGIAPGAIATEINKDLLADKPRLEALTSQIPLACSKARGISCGS
jgi:glucose 1-dehydrogenase